MCPEHLLPPPPESCPCCLGRSSCCSCTLDIRSRKETIRFCPNEYASFCRTFHNRALLVAPPSSHQSFLFGPVPPPGETAGRSLQSPGASPDCRSPPDPALPPSGL